MKTKIKLIIFVSLLTCGFMSAGFYFKSAVEAVEIKDRYVSGMNDVVRSGMRLPDDYYEKLYLQKEQELKEKEESERLEDTASDYIAYDSVDYGYYDVPYYSGYYSDEASSFMRDGVRYGENGTRYTYYSSNVLYHYRTGEWTPNENGMYTTSEGYLVVASSDYPEGTLVETPWGTGQVLDSGCSSGTIDMYVNY